jgi:hypothetical protein
MQDYHADSDQNYLHQARDMHQRPLHDNDGYKVDCNDSYYKVPSLDLASLVKSFIGPLRYVGWPKNFTLIESYDGRSNP